jgi:CRP/FNR family transcriptional regulator
VDTRAENELEDAELFRALPRERFQSVVALLRRKRFDRHSVLFFEGQPAESLWVLQRGEIRLYKSSPDGHVITLESLVPGQVFGALSAGDSAVYPASAEALTAGVAWCLPRESFVGLLEEDPGVAVEILHIVSERLRGAHERLRSFAHDRAPRRLAQALLKSTRGGEARVTRRDLADSAGTTVETAIRTLRRFEKDGLIRGAVGLIHVLDETGLQAIAGVSKP